MDKLSGFDASLGLEFAKGWENKWVVLHRIDFLVTEDLVVDVTGLSVIGAKIFKDRFMGDDAISTSLRPGEELRKLHHWSCKELLEGFVG
ncbi:hypothetical protein SUGI_0515210 [Cryptomeria japonica]|nr:hypothetical protein SUGI_0515210 [Cryptomeria japonica]